MPLLDRFRATPSHKHPDPEVRLAYIEALPVEERELLTSSALEDESARVRRAAVAKVTDPSVLARVANEDRDGTVRATAIEMLRDLALEAFEGPGEAESLAAVDGLEDPKSLAHVAKISTRESVARRALAKVRDGRALGSIARHAALEPIRRDALESIADRDEILAVAMNGEHKETAVTAVERLTDRADVELVAAGSKNKAAAKRARALIRDLDAAAAPTVEDLEESSPPILVPAIDTEAARLSEAREKEEAVVVGEDQRVRAEAVREAEARAAEERAAAQALDAERARKDAERRHSRQIELVNELEAATADPDLRSALRRCELVGREWKDLARIKAADPDLSERYWAAQGRITARDAEVREAEARVRQEALRRMLQLLTRVEAFTAMPDLTLKAAERALRDVRATISSLPPLPSKSDADDIVRRLKAAQTALVPKLQELRETVEWQRWANAGIQEQLCQQMEALIATEDVEAASAQVRALQEQWRRAADVPRAQGEILWRRFKKAHDEVWARCQTHFAAQAEERAANLARKIGLCERAEALAESTDWIQTAEEIKRLQGEWKQIGPVARGQEKTIWERFRAPCDRFFTRRHEDLSKRKAVWAANLAKKTALCERADAVADSTDWEATATLIKQLQAEWKTIGPVKKSRSEAIWKRFRASCDRFFARYAQRHEIARGERIAAREQICADLEALAPRPVEGDAPAEPPVDLLATVRSLGAKWDRELALRGVDPDRASALGRRFALAFEVVVSGWPAVFGGTDLDPNANRQRMESLVRRVETLASSLYGPSLDADAALSPATRLAAMLKDALAANTIGGRVDEESRWRAAQDEVRQAQASFARIGPVPDAARRPLADRFQRASRRILERAEKPRGFSRAETALPTRT